LRSHRAGSDQAAKRLSDRSLSCRRQPRRLPPYRTRLSDRSLSRFAAWSLPAPWLREGVTSVLIDNGIGNVNESGSVAVTPRESTTFTAIASGPGGEARGSVRVTVTEADSPGLASSDIAALMEALSSGKIKPVFFAYDKADLSEQAKEILAENARWFRRLPGAGVLVEGHCDERGTEEYNLALGDRRAQSAYQYLLELGVNPRQLETVSLGEERPFESGQGESTYSQNRRAHFSARQPYFIGGGSDGLPVADGGRFRQMIQSC